MNTLDLALKKVVLKKASGTHGGEWQGPCPGCGGTDRFHVWPLQNDGKGGYWCRGCGKTGDNIQFLRDFEGMSFGDACRQLNVTLPGRPESQGPMPEQQKKPEFQPDQHIPPADLWQEKAAKLIEWSQENLTKNADALKWLADRGIDEQAAVAARLGWNAGEDGKDVYRARKAWGLPEQLKDDGKPKALWIPRGLVIPYFIDGIVYRIRIRRPEGEPRYYVIPGSSMATMIIGRERRAFVVVESELDAILCASVRRDVGAVALGSVSAKPDADVHAVLRGALQILNALDYDAAGAKAMAWWSDHFDRCDRWPVPLGKDPGEAYQLGMDVGMWIKKGLPPALTIESPASARDVGPSKAIYREPARGDGPSVDIPPALRELYDLLRKNPSVKIINSPGRYTVLRDGKYVGGRINELVFRDPECREYILSHPAEEIDGTNLLR
jgi:DNA primase